MAALMNRKHGTGCGQGKSISHQIHMSYLPKKQYVHMNLNDLPNFKSLILFINFVELKSSTIWL